MDADLTVPGRGAPHAARARWSDVGSPTCNVEWLTLREPADAAARATDLLAPSILDASSVNPHLLGSPGAHTDRVIADLGSGSGSMGRWLAPLLPGAQHWLLHDRDAALLAAVTLPAQAGDGAPVTSETRHADVTALTAGDLVAAGAALVTASALLDLLTGDEVEALAAACVGAGVPALLTLNVTGRARLHPVEPEDPAFAAAFDAHQRRVDEIGRRLLGPDAGAAAVAAFESRGATVHTRATPWRLDSARPDRAELLEEWLREWVDAACAQAPELEPSAGPYLRRRLEALAAGELFAEVGHVDVLAVPA